MLQNRSMPRSTVIPELPYPAVREAVAWLCQTFGFTVRIEMGNHRAQLNVGDGALVVMERSGNSPTSTSVMVRVDDTDRHFERAKQHGARILKAPANYPYGERQYSVEDFAGHHWHFSQSIVDVDPRDWGGTPGRL